MDILDELTRDHARLQVRLRTIAEGGIGGEAFERWLVDLRRHLRQEDELLFAELELQVPVPAGPVAAIRSERAAIERALRRLEGDELAEDADATEGVAVGLQEAWGELDALLAAAFAREERALFPFARRILDADRLAALGALLREARDRSPAAIPPELAVADLARQYPSTIRVFQRHGIDFCCGGRVGLAAACAERGVEFTALTAELAHAIDSPADLGEIRWDTRPAVEIVGHLLARFHAGLREELTRLEAMAERAATRHGATHPELPEIRDAVAELARCMVTHLDREEQEIFPALLRGDAEPLASEVGEALAEHSAVGLLLAKLRRLSGGFSPPDSACNTWRGLYAGLEALERDTHLHVHLENNVLFPRYVGPAIPSVV